MLIEITASCSRLKLESQKLDIDAEIQKTKNAIVENAIINIRQKLYEAIEEKGYMQIELKLKAQVICGKSFDDLSDCIDELCESEADRALASKFLNTLC